MKFDMGRVRIYNGIFWLYLCLSDILQPVTTGGNFWSEKAAQLFRLNHNFDDPAVLVGNAIFPALLWFLVDRRLRRKNNLTLPTKDETES